MEQAFDHQRLVELDVCSADGVPHKEMDVDDHEEVEHSAQHSHPRPWNTGMNQDPPDRNVLTRALPRGEFHQTARPT